MRLSVKLAALFTLMIVVTLGGLSALKAAYPSALYRFRMTVEVDTPQGPKHGSSVMQVTAYRTFAPIAQEKPGGGDLRGEAVIAALPDGPLFVLLQLPDAKGPLASAVTLALDPGAKIGGIDGYVAAVNKLGDRANDPVRAELPRDSWPIMVRFRDINDPKTVEKVDPVAIGVHRITLETTRAPVTVGIIKVLHWLDDGGKLLSPNGRHFPRTPLFTQTIYQSYFSTEIDK